MRGAGTGNYDPETGVTGLIGSGVVTTVATARLTISFLIYHEKSVSFRVKEQSNST